MRKFVEKIKTYYEKGLYTEAIVHQFLEKKKINQEEYEYILKIEEDANK